LGAVIYKETLTILGVLGIILVLASVVILNIKRLRLKVHAKINLTLGILGKREDGYHFIDTVMQSVSLGDTVTLYPCKELRIRQSNKSIDPENNMAYKAANAFFTATGITGGAKIHIKNHIPTSSGMGGGSANAAAVIMGLDKLFNTKLSVKKLEEIATPLGADVPFFIRGGAQRAEGIGEILTPLVPLKKGYFILAKVDSKPSTAEMYHQLDSHTPPLPDTEAAIKALENEDANALSKLFVNSFTSVWSESILEKRLNATNADGVSLSGSGPTWFAYFSDKGKAKSAYKTLKKEKIECYFAKPETVGVKFE